jgi:antitoxin (DNA-binding transcriptional repressor) of toxin-antitoxin stability system
MTRSILQADALEPKRFQTERICMKQASSEDKENIMEEIQLVNFENNVSGIINSVINSHQPVLIRDKGKFLVKIVPISYPDQESWLGCMRGNGKITGDIISPAEDTDNWKVLSE